MMVSGFSFRAFVGPPSRNSPCRSRQLFWSFIDREAHHRSEQVAGLEDQIVIAFFDKRGAEASCPLPGARRPVVCGGHGAESDAFVPPHDATGGVGVVLRVDGGENGALEQARVPNAIPPAEGPALLPIDPIR